MNYNLGTTINNFRQAISNLTNIPLNVLGTFLNIVIK